MGASDVTINSGVVRASGTVKGRGVAGAAIAAGQFLYRDSTDGTLKLAVANGTEAQADVVGMALNNAAIGQPVEYGNEGDYTVSSGLPGVGTLLVLSDTTAGAAMQETDLGTGEYVTFLGMVSAATTLKLKIVPGGFTHA